MVLIFKEIIVKADNEELVDIAIECLSHIWQKYPNLIPLEEDLFDRIYRLMKSNKLENISASIIRSISDLLYHIPEEQLPSFGPLIEPFLNYLPC